MTENPSSSGKRIGIVTYDYDPPIGGLGVLVRTYLHAMKQLFPSDTYIVVSPAANADVRGPWFGRARYRKSGGCPLFSLALFFSLSGVIRRYALDLIHLHAGSGGVFFLRKPACSLIVTAHHTYRQEAEFVYMHSPLKRLWKLFMARLEARTYRMADAVICVSDDTAEAIITQYSVPRSRVTVIENPVHVPRLSVAKQKDTILFVGRLEARKGALLLLEAFSMLHRDMPMVKLRLLGSNLLGSTLLNIIRERGLGDSVEYLGFLPNAERFREMAQATVLVVPSTLEGFGLVAAEAMALGTCVIASDAAGLRSVVSDGRTGVLFPVGDERACADAIRRVLTDTALRERLTREALTEAPDRFGVDARSSDVRGVYDRVLLSP